MFPWKPEGFLPPTKAEMTQGKAGASSSCVIRRGHTPSKTPKVPPAHFHSVVSDSVKSLCRGGIRLLLQPNCFKINLAHMYTGDSLSFLIYHKGSINQNFS